MTRLEAAEAAGVTLRQFQWWQETGLISRSRYESVCQARIWGMISRRFGMLRKSITHSVNVRECVKRASRSRDRFLVLYICNGWPKGLVGGKSLKDEIAVLEFSRGIPGRVVVLEMPKRERI